jgi:hypothetical protein
MALTKCRECGGQVSTEADDCPHCGCENPARSRFLIKGVLGFLIIVGGIAELVQFTGLLSPDEIYRRGNQPARLVPSVWHENLGFGPLFII